LPDNQSLAFIARGHRYIFHRKVRPLPEDGRQEAVETQVRSMKSLMISAWPLSAIASEEVCTRS
jgi:hypothetical protein